MLDCISGGRLVAGVPLGQPDGRQHLLRDHADGAARALREAFELIIKAWKASEIFAWNGKYYQLREGEPVAAADPEAAPAGVGARRGAAQHLRLRRDRRSATASSATSGARPPRT